jgi:hypothetical protein
MKSELQTELICVDLGEGVIAQICRLGWVNERQPNFFNYYSSKNSLTVIILTS